MGATAYRSITGKAPLPAVDRSQMLINGEQDTFLTTLEIGAAGYSPDFLRAVDKALAFRDTERPRSIAQWREILDSTSASSAQSIENPRLQPIPTDRPSDDYAATEVNPVTESEAPTQVFVATATETARGNRFAKWFNWRIVASATVALIALLLIASNGGEPETTKIDETIAPDGRKIDPVVDKVIPPPPPLAPAEADDRIYSLLARAADDLVALRLTTPKNNNAYDKYRTVLLLDPSNTTAQRGVDQIVEKYIQLADRSVQNNDFSAARGHIERAASIQPDHPMVQRARKFSSSG